MTTDNTRTLTLNRIIDAPREKVYQCWTTPELMKRWFTPAPWKTVEVEVDLRPGGRSLIVMEDPEGNKYPNEGVYLEVIPNEKIVTTDALTTGWKPSGKAFMVAEITFEDAGNNQTNYTATARHWSEEDRKGHEEMGFHDGWGQAAQQLENVAKTI
jgi:uncharacterized protein YndB with AHSA1/START domain